MMFPMQVHDSYNFFRSHNMDLTLELTVHPEPTQVLKSGRGQVWVANFCMCGLFHPCDTMQFLLLRTDQTWTSIRALCGFCSSTRYWRVSDSHSSMILVSLPFTDALEVERVSSY
jgi:hypothetical protein